MAAAVGCYAVAKLIAVGLLGSTSPTILCLWLIVECALFLGVRSSIGNWRNYIGGLHFAPASLVNHVLHYLCMLAAPFPLLRTPFFLTPSIFAGFIVWTLFVANPSMLLLAFRFGEPNFSRTLIAWALSGTTAAFLLVSRLIWTSMTASLRHTFYRHNTCAMHVKNYWWDEADAVTFKDEVVRGDQELIRAATLTYFAPPYLPLETATKFLHDRWSHWQANPPRFFTEEWKARLPKKCIPASAVIPTPTRRKVSTITQLGQQLDKFQKAISTEPVLLKESKVNQMLNELCELELGATASDACLGWCDDHPELGCPELLTAIIPRIKSLREEAAFNSATEVIEMTTVTSLDLVSDIAVIIQLWGNSFYAIVLLALLVASQLMQSIAALLMGQGWRVAFCALFGTKPFIEAYRKLYGAQREQGGENGKTLFVTRLVQAATESVPQGTVQAIALCSTPYRSSSAVQVISLLMSCECAAPVRSAAALPI